MGHLFFECPYSKEVLISIGSWLGLLIPNSNWTDWRFVRTSSKMHLGCLDATINACIYHIWHQRNKCRHDCVLLRLQKLAIDITKELKLRFRGMHGSNLNRRDVACLEDRLWGVP
ncbi:hypothetical protein RND81_10G104100 [Saponaria officinalis]|uniref:Reverse transcriptase zinc-binding domain-containing protein n=1 Tax=Saponaria officinalis TaxID=3572 RepID=A0AAW1I1M4_SAPOF